MANSPFDVKCAAAVSSPPAVNAAPHDEWINKFIVFFCKKDMMIVSIFFINRLEMSDVMTNDQQFNSFYIVSNDVYIQFYKLIKQNPILHKHIMQKAQQNPFYLDFLRDTWILFYRHPNTLITDPLRTLYLLIRKTILDIATNNKAVNQHFEQTVNNEHLALHYALLLCESSSIYFKQAMESDAFSTHIQHIARYYYQNKHSFEPNIVTNGVDEPFYARSQAYIIQDMLHPTQIEYSIAKTFNDYASKPLTFLDVLALNKDSCMAYIQNN